jgi:hypothetical protein
MRTTFVTCWTARFLTVCALILAAGPVAAYAQARQLSLEANPIHGTAGYSRERSPGVYVGLEVGFGFPQLDRTLHPSSGDLELLDIMHIGAFVRREPSRSVALDARIQVGLGELDGCSDCFLGLLTGVSGGAFWGGKNVKVGTRIMGGTIKEFNHPVAWVVRWTPVAGLITYRW